MSGCWSASHSAPPAPPCPPGHTRAPEVPQTHGTQNPGDSHCHVAVFQKHQEVMTEDQGTLPIEQSFGGDPRGLCRAGGGGRRVRCPELLYSLSQGAAHTQLPWLAGRAVTPSQLPGDQATLPRTSIHACHPLASLTLLFSALSAPPQHYLERPT